MAPTEATTQEKPKRVCSMETLKNKVKLKECELKFHGETADKQISHNANVIRKLRTENREKQAKLADTLRAEEHVLEEVFADRKREYLSLKRLKSNRVVAEIDQKSCEAAKLLNLVKNQRQEKEERLRQLKLQIQKTKEFEKKSAQESTIEQRAHMIENSLDKVSLKMTTAKQLSEKYVEITRKIEEQNRLYPSKLEALQHQLGEMKAELATLKEGRETAVQAKDLANQDLTDAQRDFSKKRKQREQILADTRRKIEESQARREHFADKIQKNRPTQKIPSYFRNTRLSAIEGFQMKLLTAQDAFRVLRQNTAITEIADFIERFENQDEVRWRLTEQADSVRKQHDLLSKRKEDLWQEYTRLKYNGMTYISDGERALDDKQKDITAKEEDEKQLQERLHGQGEILTGVKEVLHALLKKISKYFSEEWFASHSLTDDIAFFSEKIEQIVYEVNVHEDESGKAAHKLKQDEKIMGMMTSSNNIRVRFIPSTESTDSFHYDHHENTDVPTRDDIKNSGKLVVEMRHRKPKKSKRSK